MLYSLMTVLHNFNRWLVLLFLLLALVRMVRGITQSRNWSSKDLKSIRRFALWMTLQLVLGFVLFFLPHSLVQLGLTHNEMGVIGKDPTLRFFIMVHPVMMVVAVAFSHLTSVVTRKVSGDKKKFVLGFMLLVLTTVILLTSIPWPHSEYARPLFRWL